MYHVRMLDFKVKGGIFASFFISTNIHCFFFFSLRTFGMLLV